MEMRGLSSDLGRNREMKNGREFFHSRTVERKDVFRQIRNERVWEKTPPLRGAQKKRWRSS